METMRYSEVRKPSKAPVIGFIAFVILGVSFIVFGVYIEEHNSLFGGKGDTVLGLVDIYDNENVNIYKDKEDTEPTIKAGNFNEITYLVTDKKFSDKSNSKIKSNITIPQINIDGILLEEINKKIEEEYTTRFSGFKETLASADNSYTYKVTYKVYENVIGDKKIVSITIWQRTVDDSSGNSVFDKIDTHNIDIVTKEEVSVENVAKDILGDEYKTKVKAGVKSYVVANCGESEEKFLYTMSGMESFYIKEGKFHIIINSETIVDKKYGVLDITIE